MMPDPLPETAGVEALLVRARAGDGAAENALFTRLHARVLALAKRRIWDAEAARDIAQETLRTAFEKYRDAAMPHGFFPWLFAILHHKVGNYLKRRRAELRFRAPSDPTELRWEGLAVSAGGDLAHVDLAVAIEKALGAMSPECRKIFSLLLRGAGRREICAAFPGEPAGTIDSRVSRCRARLLEHLEERRKRVKE